MFSVAVLLFLGLATIALIPTGGDNETPADPPDDPSPEDEVGEASLDAFLVADGEITTGTDGADVFTLPPNPEPFVQTTVQGGGGDDLIYLDTGTDGYPVANSQVSGGDGADVIRVLGQASTISGGADNDTIEAGLFGGEISGGAGDDHILLREGTGDGVSVQGGLGDDTIDGRNETEFVLFGGDGNDELLTSGVPPAFTDTGIVSSGGAGDDTLVHELDNFPPSLTDHLAGGPARLSGGDGADTFEIRIVPGSGSYGPAEGDPDVFTYDSVEIEDYQSGTDIIVVDLFDSFSTYTPTQASLTEHPTVGTTELTISLESSGLPAQEFAIQINATGLTWDDIAFVGDNAATIMLQSL